VENNSIMKNISTKIKKLLKEQVGKSSPGFTLVETLVAVAIFATSITGLMSITAGGINDNVFVKNKLIASYLAVEGVELVRNLRDLTILQNPTDGWNVFLLTVVNNCYHRDASNNLTSCYIDGTATVLLPTSCPNGFCPPIRFDGDSSKTYSYDISSSSRESPFTRTITIRQGGSPDEVIVTSEVTWQRRNNNHRVSYKYNLFNWINF